MGSVEDFTQTAETAFAFAMLMKVCFVASCLVAVTSALRPLDRLREKFEDIAEIAEKVPYFESDDCDNVPTDSNDFKVGLMDLCKDADKDDVICVCKPKKKCDLGLGGLLSNNAGNFKEILLEKLKDKTMWPELEYEKKCRICRMRWMRCNDDDKNCPEEEESCQEGPFKAIIGGRRRNKFIRNNFN